MPETLKKQYQKPEKVSRNAEIEPNVKTDKRGSVTVSDFNESETEEQTTKAITLEAITAPTPLAKMTTAEKGTMRVETPHGEETINYETIYNEAKQAAKTINAEIKVKRELEELKHSEAITAQKPQAEISTAEMEPITDEKEIHELTPDMETDDSTPAESDENDPAMQRQRFDNKNKKPSIFMKFIKNPIASIKNLFRKE